MTRIGDKVCYEVDWDTFHESRACGTVAENMFCSPDQVQINDTIFGHIAYKEIYQEYSVDYYFACADPAKLEPMKTVPYALRGIKPFHAWPEVRSLDRVFAFSGSRGGCGTYENFLKDADVPEELVNQQLQSLDKASLVMTNIVFSPWGIVIELQDRTTRLNYFGNPIPMPEGFLAGDWAKRMSLAPLVTSQIMAEVTRLSESIRTERETERAEANGESAWRKAHDGTF